MCFIKVNLKGAYSRTGNVVKELLDVEKAIKENKKVHIFVRLDKNSKVLERPTGLDYKYQITFFIRDEKIEEYKVDVTNK